MPESENGIYEAVKEWKLKYRADKLIALENACRDNYELEVLTNKIFEAIRKLEQEGQL